MQTRRPSGTFVLAALALAATTVRGFEPLQVTGVVGKAKLAGKVDLAAATATGDTIVTLLLTNVDRERDALVNFPACTHDRTSHGFLVDDLEAVLAGRSQKPPVAVAQDPAWSACVLSRSASSGLFLVPRGQRIEVKMAVDFRALGSQHVRIVGEAFELPAVQSARLPKKPKLVQLEDLLRRAVPAGDVPVSLFYALEQDARGRVFYRLASYAELFLRNLPTPEEGGMVAPEYRDGLLPVDLEDFRTYKPELPEGLEWDPDHRDLRLISTDSDGPFPGAQICIAPDRSDCTAFQCGPPGGRERVFSPAATIYTIKGRFSVKWTDHTLHPGWGWRAVAWWNDGGTWRVLDSQWVKWDGSYQLTANTTGYSGQNLRVQFRAYNRFYEPQNQDGNLYRWVNPDKTGISTNHDEGHRYADCDGGDANGLGEMYFRGYQLWSKMYWDAAINPLRKDPIKVFYPNTFYDCDKGDGVPWSCASTNGTMWLIPAHGTNRGTVQHELGHQINYEFWDNKRPPNSGGSHSASNCYTPGLALLEGYANYVPIWVQTNRSALPESGIRSFEIEDPTGACKTPGRNNEAWVAATFWDLHDSRADGKDILWFNHMGAVHALYLGNGPANNGDSLGMNDFRTIYRNAASAGHQTYVDDIFEQNGTN